MKYIIYTLILATLIAVFTKPTEDGVRAILKDQTLTAIQETDVNMSDMGIDGALVGLCKLQPNACWDALSAVTKLSYDDRYIYARVGIQGLGDPRTCYAAFRSLICL